MCFQLAFALHSAFWHNSFRRPRSHGCINLARSTPSGCSSSPNRRFRFHGTASTRPTKVKGTRLYIRGKTPVL